MVSNVAMTISLKTLRLISLAFTISLWPMVPTALSEEPETGVELIVLGIAQDAGFPQAACAKACCAKAWKDQSLARNATSIAVIDRESKQRWLFECSPDFPRQLRSLDEFFITQKQQPGLDGIFLTHAHIGHYTGLIHLGREVIGANETPVYCMPKMKTFLETNGPWSQLVSLKNIALQPLQNEQSIKLSERISVTPFQVPHRDEFSETVGFKIKGPRKTVVFLPDIDKWNKWDQKIENVIQECDIAYLDGTFFQNGEIPGRDMAMIPHPFVTESIKRFSSLEKEERNKIRFIHFNHTNPVLQSDSAAGSKIKRAGMNIAAEGETIGL
jgi:pyrroloquinoline quinone biosynthesis protein B